MAVNNPTTTLQNREDDEDPERFPARSDSQSVQRARLESSASLQGHEFRDRTDTAGGSGATGSSGNSTFIEDTAAPPVTSSHDHQHHRPRQHHRPPPPQQCIDNTPAVGENRQPEGSELVLPKTPRGASSAHYDSRYQLEKTGAHLETITIDQPEQRFFDKALSKYASHPFWAKSFKNRDLKYKIKIELCFTDNVSIALVLMKGHYDRHLSWPFNMSVVFGLVGVSGEIKKEKMFRCDKNGTLKSSLGKPKGDENKPIGYKQFISRESLLQDGYLVENTLTLKCFLYPKETSLTIPSELPCVMK